MKILLATEGSAGSQAAIDEVIRRPWPSGSEVKVLSVAHPIPFVPEPTLLGAAAYEESLRKEREYASQQVEKAAKRIAEASKLSVVPEVRSGSPKKAIVQEAEDWGADLIILGSHGHGPIHRFLLGSVAQAVALHACCSVEIVRCRETVGAPSGE